MTAATELDASAVRAAFWDVLDFLRGRAAKAERDVLRRLAAIGHDTATADAALLTAERSGLVAYRADRRVALTDEGRVHWTTNGLGKTHSLDLEAFDGRRHAHNPNESPSVFTAADRTGQGRTRPKRFAS